tara:strand:+ start:32 stop:634 length:603 start_codon:yes stop_codon:yes gene_type:complete
MFAYSVYIPRVFLNISKERIANIFHKLDIGDVARIDFKKKTNLKGENYHMAFVHFNAIYKNFNGESFCRDVEDVNKQAKIVYDDPWFWVVCPYISNTQSTQMLPYYPMMPSNEYMLNWNMMMPMAYPQAPMYPMDTNMQYVMPNPVSTPPMIPPQVLYNKRNYNTPKQRINVDNLMTQPVPQKTGPRLGAPIPSNTENKN